jgi:hypothetical protein
MIALSGIYQDGVVLFDEKISIKRPMKVIITFLEDIDNDENAELKFSDFSFTKSRKILENYKGSFSHSVIEERRS